MVVGQAERMDGLYRRQRHLYDLTRRFLLPGRDRLLESIKAAEGGRVLEAGCGTGRNLIALAQRRPDLELYGIDVSKQMLRTAATKLAESGIAGVKLAARAIEHLDFGRDFGLGRPFDAVFFSYCLSMTSDQRAALLAGVRNIKEGGALYAVDFWDMGGRPRWTRRLMDRWLKLFGVRFDPGLLEAVEGLGRAGLAATFVKSVGGRYAFIAGMENVRAKAAAREIARGIEGAGQ
jgi:S-adenosylmethionine-diacylgycerolhomoserine-N-methlytransferase